MINEKAADMEWIYSEKTSAETPISAGFYRLEKGTPLVYEYTYDEMKIILEGQFEISDEAGQKVTATPGDVFFFPKGSKITFTTESYGLAFYVCYVSLPPGLSFWFVADMLEYNRLARGRVAALRWKKKVTCIEKKKKKDIQFVILFLCMGVCLPNDDLNFGL